MGDARTGVVVIGAGVSGLTTALCLVEAGVPVTIVAEDPPRATTSATAGAIWGPYLVGPRHDVRRWGRQTLDEFQRLATDPASGVRMTSGIEASRVPVEAPEWASQLSEFRVCTPDELPEGFVIGWRLTAPVVDMPVYLDYLLARFVDQEGRLLERHITSFSEVASEYDVPVVVNCSGMGAASLVPDATLQPVRGQTLVVTNPGVTEFFVEERGTDVDQLHFFPHGDTIVLGGTLEPGNWSRIPDERTTRRILRACREVCPALKDTRLLEVRVGLRPSRPDVCVTSHPVPGGGMLFQNYGHGGAGVSVSWGCARETAERVLRALRTG